MINTNACEVDSHLFVGVKPLALVEHRTPLSEIKQLLLRTVSAVVGQQRQVSILDRMAVSTHLRLLGLIGVVIGIVLLPMQQSGLSCESVTVCAVKELTSLENTQAAHLGSSGGMPSNCSA